MFNQGQERGFETTFKIVQNTFNFVLKVQYLKSFTELGSFFCCSPRLNSASKLCGTSLLPKGASFKKRKQ